MGVHSIIHRRGQALGDLVAGLGLIVCNEGAAWTFCRGQVGSTIDVTFASPGAHISEWEVRLEESLSDHRCIKYRVGRGAQYAPTAHPNGRTRWNAKKCRDAALNEFLRGARIAGSTADQLAQNLDNTLREACNVSMPVRSTKPKRSVYWWNEDIATLHKACNVSGRKVHRRRRRGGAPLEEALEAWKCDRAALRKAIVKSKEASWNDLCAQLDSNPWGLSFRIVRSQLAARGPPPGSQVVGGVTQIVRALFPRQPPLTQRTPPELADPPPPVTQEEIKTAAARISPLKAPGLDGIPGGVIKACVEVNHEMMTNVFNHCFQEGVFPVGWKTAALVLIPKPGKPPEIPASYRPICLINIVAKLFERIIANRLVGFLETSDNQYGFRKGRSTVDAVARVLDIAQVANQGSIRNRQHCVMVAIDVSNAFNSIPWRTILAETGKRDLPAYLQRQLRSYLSGRKVVYDAGNEEVCHTVTAGVPQGSVLGPTLWNVAYDSLLRTEMPPGVSLVGFADDLAIVARHREPAVLQDELQEAIDIVLEWMHGAGLAVAVEKTQAAALSVKRNIGDFRLGVGGTEVRLSKTIRYLGTTIGSNRWFTPHVLQATKAAMAADRQIARLMGNTRGPGQRVRSLLHNSVVQATLLYAAPIWAGPALKAARNREAIIRVQRSGAIRTTRAYRTVSTEAAQVLAGTIPVDLLARERSEIHHETRGVVATQVQKRLLKSTARAATLAAWQERWDASANGRWTHSLVPNIERWCGRKHGECSYHTTQILTGHGSFGEFLHRIGKAETPGCVYCNEDKDDAGHTLFECQRWAAERATLIRAVGPEALTPDGLGASITNDRAAWEALATFAFDVMSRKALDEGVN